MSYQQVIKTACINNVIYGWEQIGMGIHNTAGVVQLTIA